MVEDVEDSLPDEPLLVLSLKVLELDGLLKVLRRHLCDESDIERINLFQERNELREIVPDLGFQDIDILVENGGSEGGVVSQNLVSLQPGDFLPAAVLNGAENGLVINSRVLVDYFWPGFAERFDQTQVCALIVLCKGQDDIFHGQAPCVEGLLLILFVSQVPNYKILINLRLEQT